MRTKVCQGKSGGEVGPIVDCIYLSGAKTHQALYPEEHPAG